MPSLGIKSEDEYNKPINIVTLDLLSIWPMPLGAIENGYIGRLQRQEHARSVLACWRIGLDCCRAVMVSDALWW